MGASASLDHLVGAGEQGCRSTATNSILFDNLGGAGEHPVR